MKRVSSLVCLVAVSCLVGCGSSGGYRAKSASPSAGMVTPMPISHARPVDDETIRQSRRVLERGDIALAGALAGSPAVRTTQTLLSALPGVAQGASGGTTAPAQPPPATPVPVAGAQPNGPNAPKGVREMLAVEAHVTVDVEKVGPAIVKTRELILKHGGQLINDVYSDGRNHASAALSIRIPAATTEAFLTDVGGLGRVRERRVTASDVGKQFHDQAILLRNLEVTMARYEELVKTAKETKDLLAIENELTRLRTQMDGLKSQLASLGDRVERSTIYLSLQPVRAEQPDIYEPEAHFYPDFHGTYLYDLGDKSSFVGGGVGVRASRHIGVDISALKHLDGPFKRDLLIATVGGEVYSDFLGGGRRTVGNVFLGARAGILYARSRTEAIIPLTLGIELLHTRTLTIEARGRADIFFGSSRGAHLGIQPDLGVAFAF